MDSNPDVSLDFEILRDTRTGDLFVWAPQAGCPIHLRFLDSIPGDPDGVLTYDVRTFLRRNYSHGSAYSSPERAIWMATRGL